MDRIFWNYLEGGPEQEAAWKEWQSGLTGWHRFNIFLHSLTESGRPSRKVVELPGSM